MADIKRIITHPGKFHLDELVGIAAIHIAFGCVIPISRITEKELTPEIIKGAWVLDIGSRYGYNSETDTEWFDHHQTKYGVKIRGSYRATAGLIWEQIGHIVVAEVNDSFSLNISAEKYRDVADYIYSEHIAKVDNHDLGVKQATDYPPILPIVGLYNIVSRFDGIYGFTKALEVVKDWLQVQIVKYVDNSKALKLVGEEFYEATKEGRNYLVLDQQCSYNTALMELDPLTPDRKIQFVILPADIARGGGWTVLSRQKNNDDRSPLVRLPKDSRAEFVHSSGFLANFRSKRQAVSYVKEIKT